MTGDIHSAVRRCAHRPAFTLAVVVTLAVGIGATTAVFSVVDAVLLHPLPWHEPGDLVRIRGVRSPGTPGSDRETELSWPEVQALRESGIFADVAVWREPLPYVIGEAQDALIRVLEVSANFLPLLGVSTDVIQGFSAADDFSAPGVAVLTHDAWQARFGGREDVLGLPIVTIPTTLSPVDLTERRQVVGVLPSDLRGFSLFLSGRAMLHPRGFRAPDEPEILLSLRPLEEFNLYTRSFSTIARLPPGGTTAAAANALRALDLPTPPTGGGLATVRIEPLGQSQLGAYVPPLALLFGGAALLLVAVCANVAGLLVGEARVRQYDFGVRRVLGASRTRLLRQLLAEHVVLAVAAAGVGVVVAWGITPALVAVLADRFPRMEAVTISMRVIGFALASSAATILLFGLTPAWLLSRGTEAESLGHGRTIAGWHRRWHRPIVATEVAFAIVLLVAAALFADTMFRVRTTPLGVDPAGLLVLSTRFTGGLSTSTPRQPDSAALIGSAVETLGAIPGVISAAASNAVPFLGHNTVQLAMKVPGRSDDIRASVAVVTPDYFETVGMPVVSGTSLASRTPRDGRVAVVSEAFENRFVDGSALGLRIEWRQQLVDVIGVAADSRPYHPSDDADALLYVLDGPGIGFTHFVLRTVGDPRALTRVARNALAEVSPHLVVTEAVTMPDVLARATAAERFRAVLSVVFAAAATLLVAVGLFALAARMVAERRRELGLRIALGARQGDVLALVIRDGLSTVALGLSLGLPASFIVASTAVGLVDGLSAPSPPLVLGVVLVIATTAVIATWLPARRASLIDPAEALRRE